MSSKLPGRSRTSILAVLILLPSVWPPLSAARRVPGRGACRSGPSAGLCRWATHAASRSSGVTRRRSRRARRATGRPNLQSAYALPSASAGSGQTVAIVEAFDDPTAESDLAQYRSFYGLPPCTTANGCFRKVNQTAGRSRCLRRARTGSWRFRSTWTWSARSAPTATSCSSRRTRTSTAISTPRRTPRPASAGTRSATAGAVASTAARPPATRTSTIPAWRSPPAPATMATAARTRRPRGT